MSNTESNDPKLSFFIRAFCTRSHGGCTGTYSQDVAQCVQSITGGLKCVQTGTSIDLILH